VQPGVWFRRFYLTDGDSDVQEFVIVTQQNIPPSDYFERDLARLLIVLYYGGQPVNSLLAGQTRQIDSLWRLQQFDFWVREPGQLALALLKSFASAPAEGFDEGKPNLREGIDRMLMEDQADIRRVKAPGATSTIMQALDESLSFLTACALVSDRPSFARSRQYSHQIVLEAAGMALVEKIFDTCPTFAWYRAQCELVAAYFPRLEHYDLAMMSYLAPDLNPAMAVNTRLIPFIRRRYEAVFASLPVPQSANTETESVDNH
jgi:hypothetical protein